MVRDAETHAAEDRSERERAETRNAADTLLYSAEKTLRDLGDKVAQEDRQAVETAAAGLRAALQSDDASLITNAIDELTKAAHRLAEEVYRGGGRADGPSSNGGSGARGGRGDASAGAHDAAEDVDYEVVDDGKKKK